MASLNEFNKTVEEQTPLHTLHTALATFPAYHPSDKRLRQADRLRAGEAIVKALVRHVKCNDAISVLEVNNAPLRLFDWQRLGAGLRTNGCPLRSLSRARGSQTRPFQTPGTPPPSCCGSRRVAVCRGEARRLSHGPPWTVRPCCANSCMAHPSDELIMCGRTTMG